MLTAGQKQWPWQSVTRLSPDQTISFPPNGGAQHSPDDGCSRGVFILELVHEK
jgi:hypothetical protein